MTSSVSLAFPATKTRWPTKSIAPLAIAVIGALCISVLLSLIATPTVYLLLRDRQLDMAEHGLFPGRTELAESELM